MKTIRTIETDSPELKTYALVDTRQEPNANKHIRTVRLTEQEIKFLNLGYASNGSSLRYQPI